MKLTAIIVIAAIVLASLLILMTSRSGAGAIVIDGDLSDWASIPSYDFSLMSSNKIHGVSFAKMCIYHENLLLSMSFEGTFLSGSSGATALYIFVDLDGDPDTGFSVNQKMGAEWYARLIKYEGDPNITATAAKFIIESDNYDWNGWGPGVAIKTGQNNKDIELSLKENIINTADLDFPVVQLVAIDDDETQSPLMTDQGTIVGIQKSMIPGNQIVIASNEYLLNLSVTIMGIEDSTYSVTPMLVDKNGVRNYLADIDASSGTWTSKYISGNLSSLSAGGDIKYDMMISSHDFPGAIDVLGDSARGYYRSIPAEMRIDGLFADWIGNTSMDNDSSIVGNPDIDIKKIGMKNENDNYFFYTKVAGLIFGGTEAPDYRTASVSGASNPSTSATNRRTGDDVLKAYIDQDPGTLAGYQLTTGNATIRADYLIEISGKNGQIGSDSIKAWSNNNFTWYEIGNVDEFDNAYSEMEFSIGEDLLGNLSGSVVLFVLNDWKSQSDSSKLGDAMINSFKININGQIWGSSNGKSWLARTEVPGSPSSMADLTSDSYGNLYALFENGTVYKSKDYARSWSRQLIIALDPGDEAIGITSDTRAALYMLTSNGSVYYGLTTGAGWLIQGALPAPTLSWADIDWTYGYQRNQAVLYAIESGSSGNISKSINGGLDWSSLSNISIVDDNVISIAAIRISGNDTIYVLEQDGDIRISNDSAANWSSTNVSLDGGSSNCTDLCIDSQENLWVVDSQGKVYHLNTTTWVWISLYESNDTTDVKAIIATIIEHDSDRSSTAFLSVIVAEAIAGLSLIHLWQRRRRIYPPVPPTRYATPKPARAEEIPINNI